MTIKGASTRTRRPARPLSAAVKKRILNAQRFLDKVNSLAPEMSAQLEKANDDSANEFVGHAKAFARSASKSPKLADSIVKTMPGDVPPAYSQGTGSGAVVPPLGRAVSAGNSKFRLAHIFERGTKERFTESGAYRGRVLPRPFFWIAYRLTKKKHKARVRKAISAAARKIARQ